MCRVQQCSWRCVTLAAGRFQPGRQRGILPVVQVSRVSAAVMEIVLDFIYTDLLVQLPEAFLSEGGADELFDAADRYLLFSMKVSVCQHPTPRSFVHFPSHASPEAIRLDQQHM